MFPIAVEDFKGGDAEDPRLEVRPLGVAVELGEGQGHDALERVLYLVGFAQHAPAVSFQPPLKRLQVFEEHFALVLRTTQRDNSGPCLRAQIPPFSNVSGTAK
jgi:hypothetical protein